jgi:hypothetical protein
MRGRCRLGALVCVVVIGTAALGACSGGGDERDDQAGRAGGGQPSEEAMAALQAVTLTGPIGDGTRPNAFGAPTVDLGAAGYVAEEFFYEGQATAYEPAPGAQLDDDGRWALEPSRQAPFKTRMLVIRPAEAETFSGTVWVEWLNVTAGFDIGDVTPESLRDGDAVVYVSAQQVGLDGTPGAEENGLRGWDPQRYGSLAHPGDDFSYDIFTKAALLVGPHRGTQRTDPMHGFDVDRVLGVGASQSAFRLTSYLNGVQPLTGALDGALLLANFGRSTRFETPDNDPGTIESTFLRSTRIRDDLGIPVMLVTTETEAESLYPVRQPDTDTFRTWEIAGASHAGAAGGVDDVLAIFTRDQLTVPAGAFGSTSGAVGTASSPNFMRWLPVASGARGYLARWTAGGAAPPSLPLITIEGDPPQIQRDEHGNALGGIRMPEMDVPVATYRGNVEGADAMSSLFGSMTPFPPERLRTLYPSRDAYLDAYGQAVDRAVEAGYFDARDADSIEQSAVTKAAELFPA